MALGMTRDLLTALRRVVAEQDCWEGTATELLALLPPDAGRADATRVAGVLRAAAKGLRDFGVVVETRREAGTGRRLLTLRLAQNRNAALDGGMAGDSGAERVQDTVIAAEPATVADVGDGRREHTYGTAADTARAWYAAMRPKRA